MITEGTDGASALRFGASVSRGTEAEYGAEFRAVWSEPATSLDRSIDAAGR